MINEGAAFKHCGENAIAAQGNASQIIVSADAANHKFGVLCGLRWGRSLLSAMFGDPFIGFG
jgi:hypothetical protein